MDILQKVFKWHETRTEWWIEQFGLSNYQALWFAWFKGILTVLILQWIF
tara:strand:+ start:1445 stop:1591 length:147 start_codon:yes stop_codon:yes gene_type:complete